jgi:hypothetical protein
MPGNLASAAPTGVLPQNLCTAFREVRAFPVLANTYHDGASERGMISDGINTPVSLKSWVLAQKLTASQLATLTTFFEAKNGGLLPFYFYNPFEPASGSNYDATGASTQGRHGVVFQVAAWDETTGLPRTDVGFGLAEVA